MSLAADFILHGFAANTSSTRQRFALRPISQTLAGHNTSPPLDKRGTLGAFLSSHSEGLHDMLTEFRFRGFKSFAEGRLPLSNLTVLVGANAAGKSNALEAVSLLSWLARGRRLDELGYSMESSDAPFRGDLGRIVHGKTTLSKTARHFSLGCSIESDGRLLKLDMEFSVSQDGMRIIQETLTTPSEGLPLYRVDSPASGFGHDMQVAYNNFKRGRNKPKVTASDQQAVFTQLLSPAALNRADKQSQSVIPESAERVKAALEGVVFLEPNPALMRGYVHYLDRRLRRDASNLSAAAYAACRDGAKTEILDFIKCLPEQDIVDVGFFRTQKGDVLLKLKESFGKRTRWWDASVLSDGTLRALAVAVCLLTAPVGSTVVVEEIDNGVHPTRARDLLSRILTTSTERGLRVLLTTHNPAMLDALPDRVIPDVVFTYRDPANGASRLVRLEELWNYPELVGQGPLGSLVTRGIVERFVKESQRESEAEARTAAWLDDFTKWREGLTPEDSHHG